LCIGVDRFGASAPASVLGEQYGLTPQAVTERIRAWLG
jgi:transketolase